MKNLILIAVLPLSLLATDVWAQNKQFEVLSKDAEPAKYQSHLKTSGALSYLQYLQWRAEDAAPEAPSLSAALELSEEKPLLALELFEKSLQEIAQFPWGNSSRELVISIYEKLVGLKIPSTLQNRYREQLAIVKSNAVSAGKKPLLQMEVDILARKLQQRLPAINFEIWVNGKPLRDAGLDPTHNFHFALVSDSTVPLYFWGSWSDFQKFANLAVPGFLAEGNCDTQKNDLRPLELAQVSKVFWGESCLEGDTSFAANVPRNLTTVETESRQKNMWLWPVAIVAGALAYSSLQNKDVSIEWPSLQF